MSRGMAIILQVKLSQVMGPFETGRIREDVDIDIPVYYRQIHTKKQRDAT